MATVSGLCLIFIPPYCLTCFTEAIPTSSLQITAQIGTAKLVWSFNRSQKKYLNCVIF